MPEPTPSVGRIVQYQLAEHTGFVGHVGNHSAAGDVYPAVIVRVWGESTITCNLQVLLDGTDTYWATSRAEGTEAGTWAWPERV
ncbi:hypothetical protein [Streptomyces sp. NPDC047028]|uniref:hypothetical protein n=1 Tax=Streptomyces sp. NPDC047028 TaxID=3155793 RepID=UPI003402D9BD